MRLVQFTNNAKSRLAANITSSATTLDVTPGDGAKFPSLTGSAYFYCTLVKTDGTAEIIKVTGRSTDTFTIERAVEPINSAQTAFASRPSTAPIRSTLARSTSSTSDVVVTAKSSHAPTNDMHGGRPCLIYRPPSATTNVEIRSRIASPRS